MDSSQKRKCKRPEICVGKMFTFLNHQGNTNQDSAETPDSSKQNTSGGKDLGKRILHSVGGDAD